MQELGKIHQLIIPMMGHNMTINLETIAMTWIVIITLLVFGYMATRKSGIIPGAFQVIGELFVFQLYGLTEDALNKERAKKYAPLITALFLFLVLSDWIGMFPYLEEPTKDLNTPLSLGLMGFFIAHYAGIKSKGFKKYIKAYFEPIFFMMPLTV